MQTPDRSRYPLIHRRVVAGALLMTLLMSVVAAFPADIVVGQDDSEAQPTEEGQQDSQETPESEQPETQQAESGAAIVIVRKLLCPPGFGFEDGSDYFNTCQTAASGVPFSATSATDGSQGNMVTAPNGNGIIEQLSPGLISVQETGSPTGYTETRVFCAVYADGSGNPGPFNPVQQSGPNQITVDVPAGSILDCYWFNLAPAEVQEPGKITIHKLICGGEIGPNPTFEDYVGPNATVLCEPGPAGFSYQIAGESSASTDGQGTASLPGYLGQPLQIVESVGTPPWNAFEYRQSVYCRAVPPAGVGDPGPYQGGPISGGPFQWANPDYVSGADLDCYWINFVQVQTMHVKSVCDEDGSADYATLSRNELFARCDQANGVPFSITGAGGETNGGPSPYTYSSSAMASDYTYRVAEEMPEGYDAARVFCTSYVPGVGVQPSVETGPTSYENGSASIDYLHRGYAQVVCNWFNFRQQIGGETTQPIVGAEPGTVTVRKFLCPFGYEGSSLDNYLFDCPTPHADVQNAVAYGDDEAESTTDESGESTYNSIPPGPVAIVTEEDGYLLAKIYCRIIPTEPANGKASFVEGVILRDGSIAGAQYELPEDAYLECYLFDLPLQADGEPPPNDGGSSVSIHKYICSFGYEGDSLGDYIESCTSPQSDVNFNVDNGGENGGSTNQNGEVTILVGDNPGTVIVSETLSEGYGLAKVFCQQYLPNEQNGDAAGYESVGLLENGRSIQYTIDDGFRVECYFFNELLDADAVPPPPEGGAQIQFHKYVCPSQYPYESAGLSDLLASCQTPQDGVPFTVEYDGGTQTVPTDADGRAVISGFPYGSFVMSEDTLPGYQLVRIFCATYEANGLASGSSVVDGTLDLNLYAPFTEEISEPFVFPGQLLEPHHADCIFFNVSVDSDVSPTAEAAATGALVTIYKYLCPPDPDDFEQSCIPPMAGVEMGVEFDGGGQSGATGLDGKVEFSGVPYGEPISIEESLGEGYDLIGVRCSVYVTGGSPGEFVDYQLAPGDRRVEYELEAGTFLECHFYNILVDGVVTPTTEIDDSGGRIVVSKYLCPDDVDLSQFTFDQERRDTCPQTMPGIEYIVLASDGTEYSATTGTTGFASIEDVPAGEVSIEEIVPPAYATLGVYCATEILGAVPFGYTEIGTTGASSMSYDLPGGNVLSCEWYNIAVTETDENAGTITVQKWLCGAEYPDVEASLEDWYAACPDRQSEASFYVVVDGEAGSAQQPDSGGQVTLPRPLGEARLYEQYSPNYRPVNAYCEIRDPGEEPVGPTYDEATSGELGNASEGEDASIDMGGYNEPHAWYCDWFNTPVSEEVASAADTGMVLAHKYVCPAGYDYETATRDELSGACEQPEDGVSFLLDLPAGSIKITDENGIASWTDIPAGDIPLLEGDHPGYLVGKVFCGDTDRNSGTSPVEWNETPYNAGLTAELRGGYYLHCEFYNVPEQYAGGTVIVRKLLCPPGFGINEERTFTDYGVYCPSVHAEQAFRVSQNDQEMASAETDGVGWAQMSDVPAGSIRITEFPKEGWPQPVAFCRTYPSGMESLPDYESAPVDSWGIAYEMQEGYAVECFWFNIPPAQEIEGADSARILIHKYFCEADFGGQSPTDETLIENCSSPQAGVEFLVEPSDEPAQSATTDADGSIAWDDLAPGLTKISESPPTGYSSYRILCRTYSSEKEPPDKYARVLFNGDQFAWDTKAGYTLDCNWYNIEQGGVPTPTMTATSTSTSTATLTASATPTATSTPSSTATSTLTATSSPTSTGTVSSTATPSSTSTGTVTSTPTASTTATASASPARSPSMPTVMATAPGGQSGSSGSGQTSGGNTQPTQSAGNGMVAVDVTPGVQPPGSSTLSTPAAGEPSTAMLIITKHTCEPGFDVLVSATGLDEKCSALTDNVLFTLEGNGVEEIGITGDEEPGLVAFADLDPGSYVVTEAMPEEAVAAFVSACASDRRAFYEDNPFAPFAFAGPDGQIGIALVAGETLACDWYNVLAETSVGSGEIVVTKYWCPDSAINDSCVLYEDGVSFAFSDVDNPEADPILVNTDETGSGSAPAEGRYTIEEAGESAICLVDTSAIDNEGHVVVEADESVTIKIYNCGPRPGS